jgi:hypothetical protein
LASLLGILALTLGFWLLMYSDSPGGNVAFILANAAIPEGVILCLYRFDEWLKWSVGF